MIHSATKYLGRPWRRHWRRRRLQQRGTGRCACATGASTPAPCSASWRRICRCAACARCRCAWRGSAPTPRRSLRRWLQIGASSASTIPVCLKTPTMRLPAGCSPKACSGRCWRLRSVTPTRPRSCGSWNGSQLIRAAPTMGDCFSLVLYPVIASHRGLTPDQRRERGIHDNVVRFSAGIEDPADLIADLDQALG